MHGSFTFLKLLLANFLYLGMTVHLIAPIDYTPDIELDIYEPSQQGILEQ